MPDSTLQTLTDQVRDWIGTDATQTSDSDILTSLASHGNNPLVTALSILRRQRVAMIRGGATQFAVANDYSENRDGQLKALDLLIAELENRTGDLVGRLPVVTTAHLARARRGR